MRHERRITNNPIYHIQELIKLQSEHADFIERGLNPIFPAGALDFYEILVVKILIQQIQLDLIKIEDRLNIFENHLKEALKSGQQS
jgi:hypothetical protein